MVSSVTSLMQAHIYIVFLCSWYDRNDQSKNSVANSMQCKEANERCENERNANKKEFFFSFKQLWGFENPFECITWCSLTAFQRKNNSMFMLSYCTHNIDLIYRNWHCHRFMVKSLTSPRHSILCCCCCFIVLIPKQYM